MSPAECSSVRTSFCDTLFESFGFKVVSLPECSTSSSLARLSAFGFVVLLLCFCACEINFLDFPHHAFSFLLLSSPFLKPSSSVIPLFAASFQHVLAFVSPFLLLFHFDSISSSSAKHLLLVKRLKTQYPETHLAVAFGFGVPGTYCTRYFDM